MNIGDEWGRRLADDLEDLGRAPLVTFGFSPDAEIRPEGLELGARRQPIPRGRASTSRRSCVGSSTSRTFSARSRQGFSSTWTRMRSPRESRAVDGVPGRFEAIDEGQPFAVVVDYAHTPDSLATVLSAARGLGSGRVIVVFGAGGDRDRGKRPLMGKVAADLADVTIVTSDNPRSEEPLAIIQDVLQGAGMDVEIDPDRRERDHSRDRDRGGRRRRRDRGQGSRAGPGRRGRGHAIRRPCRRTRGAGARFA